VHIVVAGWHVCCIQVHYIMDEMLLNGCIVDTNKTNILEPVQLLENVS
jgi:AP-4 complex subunit sigma-1